MNRIVLPGNDNSPFGGEIIKIPELFLRTYQQEILDWAQKREQFLDLRLWNPPNATVISAGWQGSVRLRVDGFQNEQTKAMRFVIQPDTEDDERRIRNHCQELPSIMAAHKAAAQAQKGRRGRVAKWVFDGTVPDYFVHRYQGELRAWANNLKKMAENNGDPFTKHIVLREGVFSDPSPNEELGPQLIRVELKCKIERIENDELRIVVRAADEEQERRIKRHCEKLQRKGIPAGMVLVEPERAGVPFMPDKVT